MIKEGKIYQTDKYGIRQQQAYVITNDKVYQTDKYGNRQQQAFVLKPPSASSVKNTSQAKK